MLLENKETHSYSDYKDVFIVTFSNANIVAIKDISISMEKYRKVESGNSYAKLFINALKLRIENKILIHKVSKLKSEREELLLIKNNLDIKEEYRQLC